MSHNVGLANSLQLFLQCKTVDWQGCARFPEIVQNFSERQILWSLCSVDLLALTLKFKLHFLWHLNSKFSVEKCENFRKSSIPSVIQVKSFVLNCNKRETCPSQPFES